MKKLGILMFVTAALFFASQTNSSAQIRVSLNINSQPLWGPVDNDYVEYYYLPEYDMYYNAPEAQFVYRSGSTWEFSKTLPYKYRNANLDRTYKVVVNEQKPYLRNDFYASKYKKYKNFHSKQVNIRDSRDRKYDGVRNHQNGSKNDKVDDSRGRNDQQKYNKKAEKDNRKDNKENRDNKNNKDNKNDRN